MTLPKTIGYGRFPCHQSQAGIGVRPVKKKLTLQGIIPYTNGMNTIMIAGMTITPTSFGTIGHNSGSRSIDMMWLLHSGLLSFTVALFIAVCGIATWRISRNVGFAIMNFGFVLMNLAFGVMNVMTHPEIWQ